MIEKFSANTAVRDESDTHRFLNGSMLEIIEGESDEEHLIEADGRG